MAAVHGQGRERNGGNARSCGKKRYDDKLKRTGIDRETDQISPVKGKSAWFIMIPNAMLKNK